MSNVTVQVYRNGFHVEARQFDTELAAHNWIEHEKEFNQRLRATSYHYKLEKVMSELPEYIVTDDAEYYVRAMFTRGMITTKEQIKNLKRMLEKEGDIPGLVRQSIENMLAYQRQMLRETVQQCSSLDKHIIGSQPLSEYLEKEED